MLKNKESRDKALLLFMLVVSIAFLVYMFIPSGSNEPEPRETTFGESEKKDIVEKVDPTKNIIKKTPSKKTKRMPGDDDSGSQKPKLGENETSPEELLKKREILCDIFNKKLEIELDKIYQHIVSSKVPFERIPVEQLENLLNEYDSDALQKVLKFGFFDLSRVLDQTFPQEYIDSIKFNIYLALFLIKMEEENGRAKIQTLSKTAYEDFMDFHCYQLKNNEIQENFHAIPILFHYVMWMNRLNIYPVEDILRDFKGKIEQIRDLSEAKHLNHLKNLIQFSVSIEKYAVRWREHDAIGADDKKEYGNVEMKTYRFLEQNYLVLPEPEQKEGNLWIEELCDADPNNIELADLKIFSEDPTSSFRIKKIIYSPLKSRFYILLKISVDETIDSFVARVMNDQMDKYHNKMLIVDFTRIDEIDGTFKDDLKEFGKYLKRSYALVID